MSILEQTAGLCWLAGCTPSEALRADNFRGSLVMDLDLLERFSFYTATA